MVFCVNCYVFILWNSEAWSNSNNGICILLVNMLRLSLLGQVFLLMLMQFLSQYDSFQINN